MIQGPAKRSIDVQGLSHNVPIPMGARVANILCSSGISGKDSTTSQLPSDAATQVLNAFKNLDAFLAAGGARLQDVVKLTLYIKDNSVRDAINIEWLGRFPDVADRPARHALVYDLQHGMLIQLEVMAVIQ